MQENQHRILGKASLITARSEAPIRCDRSMPPIHNKGLRDRKNGYDHGFTCRKIAFEHQFHCALMPAALKSLPHLTVSSTTNLPNSAVVIGAATVPSSASCAWIFASARPALTAALSLSMISAGVPLAHPSH